LLNCIGAIRQWLKRRNFPVICAIKDSGTSRKTTLSIPEIPEAMATVNTESHASSVSDGVEMFTATYVRPVLSRRAAACFAPLRLRVALASVANF